MASHFVLRRAEEFRDSRRLAAKFITKVIREIEHGARVRALQGEYVTGALAASIYREGPHITPTRVSGRVGSRINHARVTERGAPPHFILPRRPGGKLKFYWRKVGKTVYMDFVRHPGMKGKRWLEIPAREVAARHNLIVREVPD
jgi:hypothetical protein